jgi:hypothetical protein
LPLRAGAGFDTVHMRVEMQKPAEARIPRLSPAATKRSSTAAFMSFAGKST